MALVCSTFNLSCEYLDEKILWADWLVKLFTALRIDERKRYEAMMLAGGKQSDWIWVYHIEFHRPASNSPEAIEAGLLGAFSKNRNVARTHASIESFAAMYGMPEVYQLEDGTFMDSTGQQVTIPVGAVYVKTG